MQVFEYVLILLMAILLSNLINRFVPVFSAPIIQIILGVCIALIPLGPFELEFELEPSLFFVLFISPLVFHSSMTFNKKMLWELRKPIINIAVLLVFITVIISGYFINFLIPTISLSVAFVLAAALAPTDDVAVHVVAKKNNVPSKIMSILGGESIANDASGIVCFQFALASLMTGYFSPKYALIQLLILGVGGIITGLILTWIKYAFLMWIRSMGMENVTLHVLIGLLTPFIIYIVAEEIEVSGILAIFSSGIVHSFMREKFNPETVNLNIASDSVWSVISFTFEGLVFIMLGTQLPHILHSLEVDKYSISILEILIYATAITLLFAFIRFLWWITTVNKNFYENSNEHISKLMSGIIFSLSGTKGTVTLAIVMSIPILLTNGEYFPDRDLIILLATSVIVISLIITNFALPLLVGKRVNKIKDDEEIKAYKEILQGVIIQLNNESTSENEAATHMVVRNYYNRCMWLERQQPFSKLDKENEFKLRTEVLKWEEENSMNMLSKGETDEETITDYLEVSRIRLGKKVNFFKKLALLFKHLNHNKKRVANLAHINIWKSNNEYVLKKLQDMKEVEDCQVVRKLIMEVELHLSIHANLEKRNMELKKFNDNNILEVVSKGFQIERDLIQQMYECGRVSREFVKEMRGNIKILETQL